MSTAVETSERYAPVRRGWWNEPFGVFQTNLREIDATLDVERTLDVLTGHGADVWLLNVGGILSHYPTHLPFQTRNPYLDDRPGGDLVADALAASRRRGVRLLARMDFSKVSPSIADSHPEWLYRSPSGERQVYEGLVSVCPRGDYYQRRLFDVLDEVLDRYGVDGFFFNWFGFNEVDYGGIVHGVCHCDRCREAWVLAEGDRPLPGRAGEPGYAAWKRMANATIDALTARVVAHIGARRPDAALILGRSADILFHEANNAIGRDLRPYATGDAVSAMSVAQPEKPVLVNAVAFIDMPYRLASEQPEMMAQYLMQAVARGANPSTYIMGPADRIAYDCLPTAGAVTRLHRDHADVYAGLRSIASVVVVIPDALRFDDAERAAHARLEYDGVCAALRETHVPFDLVAQDDLTLLPFDRFEVVVLPDVRDVDDEWLEAFLDRGGRVVSSGGAGIAPDGSTSPWHPAHRCSRGVSDADRLKSSYVQLVQRPEVEGSALVPRHGTAYELEWECDARLSHPVIEQAAFGPPEKAHGHVPGAGWAVGSLPRGTGLATALAWTPGRTYAELGLTAVREVIAEIVSGHGGRRTVALEGPEALEVVAGRSDAGLVVHLLNHSGQRRNSFGPVLPIRGATLRLPGMAGAAARALVAPDGIRVEEHADDLVLVLDEILDAEVVVIVGEAYGADVD